jgi:hypothetical protein
VHIRAPREHQERPSCPSYPHTHYLHVSGAPARLPGVCAHASPLGHLQCFRPSSPLLQFLELSDSVYRRCNYPIQPPVNARVPPFPPQCRSHLEVQFRSLSLPECAARVRALSKIRGTFRGPVRPKLRSFEVRASVRDRTRSPSFRSGLAIPGAAARVHALSEAGPKSLGSGRTPLQSLVYCRVLCNTLQHFTPPRTCCWLGEHVGFVLGDSFLTD